MKKKSFVLSWGRKMFFGLGWALTSLMGLTYFQSMIIPQTFEGWLYFITTFIGHYGLIISLVYFLLYKPVISLLPSYYISRLWSIILILSVNLFIFFDSYLFGTYRFHINSFLWDFLQEEDALLAIGINPLKLGSIAFVTGALFILLWMRGERLWRYMQTRFSNPVSNWYLVVIVLCLIASQAMYVVGDAKGARYTRLSAIFPLHFSITGKTFLKEKGLFTNEGKEGKQTYKDFYYPSEPLNCSMKQTKNVLLVVMDKLNDADINEYQMSNLYHYASHGISFKNHYSGGFNKNDGYFSLLYSIAPPYSTSALSQAATSAFLGQVKKSNLDITFFEAGGKSPLSIYQPEEKGVPLETIESHLAERDDLAVVNPFIMQVYLENASPMEKDNNLKSVIDLFIKHELITNTIIVITGAYTNELRTPMVMIWPGKEKEVITNLTSHYDVLPTIMQEDWKCRTPLPAYSFGKNFFNKTLTTRLVRGDSRDINILDDLQKTVTTISPTDGVEVVDLVTGKIANEKKDRELVLETLKEMTRVYKR